MTRRFLLACVATILLFVANAQGLWPEGFQFTPQATTVIIIIAVLAASASAYLARLGLLLGKKLGLIFLGLVWLGASGIYVYNALAPLVSYGMSTACALVPCALALSLWLGYLALLQAQLGKPLEAVLLSGLPAVSLCLAFLSSAGATLIYMPIFSVAGFFFPLEPVSEDDWIEGAVKVLEGFAQQFLAWGLAVASILFFRELENGRTFPALFVGFSYGFGAWIGSGLLWGGSVYVKMGWLRRLWLYSRRFMFD